MLATPPLSKTETLPPLIKIREISKYLSVSRCTVRKLIESGDLTASKINGRAKERTHVRVTRDSLLTFYKKRFGHSLTRALTHSFEP